jgi:hypothetical protein
MAKHYNKGEGEKAYVAGQRLYSIRKLSYEVIRITYNTDFRQDNSIRTQFKFTCTLANAYHKQNVVKTGVGVLSRIKRVTLALCVVVRISVIDASKFLSQHGVGAHTHTHQSPFKHNIVYNHNAIIPKSNNKHGGTIRIHMCTVTQYVDSTTQHTHTARWLDKS